MSREGHHGHAPRERNVPPTGITFEPGRFGRLVPELSMPLDASDEHLVELGLAMVDEARPPEGDNENITAGFTYLGQFIDHDITLDTTTLSEVSQDPWGEENFRTPRLDLDSVYGLGPRVQPSLYDRNSPGRAKLLVGKTSPGGRDANIKAGLPHDLPRNPQGMAIIGDERNDENLIVAQLHLAFLRFHNAIVDHLVERGGPDGQLFDRARRAVVDLYQAMVIRDFLPKICDPNDIALAIERRRFFRFEQFGKFQQPYMPLEFSVAAYRFGHSMVRERYSHNRVFNPVQGASEFSFFFLFTAKSGIIGAEPGPGPQPAPPATFPGDWIIDWRRYFDFKTEDKTGDFALNLSRRIDPYLAPALHRLPPSDGNPTAATSLAVMNLRRGAKMRLPAGQDLARFMGLPILDPGAIAKSGPDGKVAEKHGLHVRTPLWYYILKEAQLTQKGARLGPLGSLIVAETFVGLMQGDPESILSRDPSWRFHQPIADLILPGADKGFTFTDLIAVAVGGVEAFGTVPEKRLLSPVDDDANLMAPAIVPAGAGAGG